jgi:hypothetical protein
VPSGPAATSLRKVAPGIETSPSGRPLVRSNLRTTSMSATQSTSPATAMPLGACSVTPPSPPRIQKRSMPPSGRTRAIEPLSSFASGAPWMLLTR